MNSKDSATFNKKIVEDNGPKWGSNVKQNADQSFPFDAKMREERPTDWMNMITERTSWLNRNSKYDYTTGKMYPRATATSKKFMHTPFATFDTKNAFKKHNDETNYKNSGAAASTSKKY